MLAQWWPRGCGSDAEKHTNTTKKYGDVRWEGERVSVIELEKRKKKTWTGERLVKEMDRRTL